MKTILVVEDDKNQRLLYQQELSLEGYNVIAVSDGQDAIDKVNEQLPDLIIMDIHLVKMSGIDTMNRILGKHKKIPIIINTAYSSYKDNFLSWSADAYIVKSSDLTELKSKVQELVGKTDG